MKRMASTVAVALACAACNQGLSQIWQLTDFRVLGVKADPPEVNRGQTSQLTLVSADPLSRPVQVFWLACSQAISLTQIPMDAGTGIITPTGCSIVTVPGGIPIPDLGTTVTLQVPPTGGQVGAGGSETMTILGYACAGGTIGAPVDGGTQPTCTPNSGTAALGWQFTRTFNVHNAMSQDPPNSNPQITEVRFGMLGQTTAVDAQHVATIPACTDTQNMPPQCQRWSFEVGFSDTSREMFHQLEQSDGGTAFVVRPEHLTTGFVVDRGQLAGGFRTDSDVDPVTNMENDYFAPSTPGDVNVYLYAIDGRGGFDWTQRVIHVQ